MYEQDTVKTGRKQKHKNANEKENCTLRRKGRSKTKAT